MGFSALTLRRAKSVLEMAAGAGVAAGSGVDLLLDNLPELRGSAEARALVAEVRARWPRRCEACGAFGEADQSCGCFDNGGQ